MADEPAPGTVTLARPTYLALLGAVVVLAGLLVFQWVTTRYLPAAVMEEATALRRTKVVIPAVLRDDYSRLGRVEQPPPKG